MSVISLIVVDPNNLDNINDTDIVSLITAILPLTPFTLLLILAKSSKLSPLARYLEILFVVPSEIFAVSEGNLFVTAVSTSEIVVKSISSVFVGVIVTGLAVIIGLFNKNPLIKLAFSTASDSKSLTRMSSNLSLRNSLKVPSTSLKDTVSPK